MDSETSGLSYINVFRLAVVFQVYMPFEGRPIHLTTDQRNDLEEIARSRALAAGFVQRAKIVLLLADGVSARAVATKLEVSRPTIAKWRRRFLEGSVDGLTSHYTGRAPWKLTARVRARVLAATRRPPPRRDDALVLPPLGRPLGRGQGETAGAPTGS